MVDEYLFRDSNDNIIEIQIWTQRGNPVRLRIIEPTGWRRDIYWKDNPEEFKLALDKMEAYISEQRNRMNSLQMTILRKKDTRDIIKQRQLTSRQKNPKELAETAQTLHTQHENGGPPPF